ncbi:MAG: hypothetical protein AB8G14_15185 [Ilumatobacter sp.]
MFDPDDSTDLSDGRVRRRVRNMEVVRSAILEILSERLPLTIETVAERAGVASRSIQRYFGDLDAAVTDAQDVCLQRAYDLWEAQELPSHDLSLEERVEVILDQRFEMERIGRPMRFTQQNINPDPQFDSEVLQVFEPELAQMTEAQRRRVGNVVAWALRPRAIRSHLDSSRDEVRARETVRFSVISALSNPT